MNLHSLGLKTVGDIHRNVPPEELIKTALKRDEGVLGMNGALMVDTGNTREDLQRINLLLRRHLQETTSGGGR